MNKKESKIVLICGYPKSGSTWLSRLFAEVIDCPVRGSFENKGKGYALEGENRISDYVCYKSHSSYDQLKKDHSSIYKYIYIIRDPRDVLVSAALHFHFLTKEMLFLKKLNGLALGLLKPLIVSQGKKIPLLKKQEIMLEVLMNGSKHYTGCDTPWQDHLYSFIPQENVYLVKYEDLLRTPDVTLKKLLSTFDISVSNEKLQSAIHNQSFDQKKNWFKSMNDGIRYNHMRKGASGDWKNDLEPKITKQLNAKLRKSLIRFNYEV